MVVARVVRIRRRSQRQRRLCLCPSCIAARPERAALLAQERAEMLRRLELSIATSDRAEPSDDKATS